MAKRLTFSTSPISVSGACLATLVKIRLDGKCRRESPFNQNFYPRWLIFFPFLLSQRSDIIRAGREMQYLFTCFLLWKIPRILLIKGKLHWRAKKSTSTLPQHGKLAGPSNLQFSNITGYVSIALFAISLTCAQESWLLIGVPKNRKTGGKKKNRRQQSLIQNSSVSCFQSISNIKSSLHPVFRMTKNRREETKEQAHQERKEAAFHY